MTNETVWVPVACSKELEKFQSNSGSSFLLLNRFPTIFFVPKNGKNSPRKYEGGREVDDFIKFLARESTNPLSGYDRSGKKQKKKSKTDDL